jgi:hypothetical protein
VERVTIEAYVDEKGVEVPAHTIRVMTPEEIEERQRLNYENTSASLRKRREEQLIKLNGHGLPPQEREG